LNWVPLVVDAVNGLPLKKVAWISLGAMRSAAKAADAERYIPARMSGPARMNDLHQLFGGRVILDMDIRQF
jgi:hypothetical protein